MPIDPVKIPQNVYIEDRIVGPLTLRQIVIVGIGSGFSYTLWSSLSKVGKVNIITTILVWIPAALSVIFAFFKMNDLTLFRLLLLMFEKFNKAGVRTWQPRRGITVNIRTFANEKEERERKKHELMPKKEPSRIDSLSTDLDTANIPLDDQDKPIHVPAPVDRGAVTAEPRSTVSVFRDVSPAPTQQ